MFPLLALLIFAALAAAAWWAAVALYRDTVGGPDPAAAPGYATARAVAVLGVTLTSFAPFPAGYALNVLAWASAVYGFLGLPHGKAAVLVGYLALASAVTRLLILGVLDVT